VERRLIGAIAAGAFLAYMLLWWNSYFAPNNGGEIVIMNEYLHGRLPYGLVLAPTTGHVLIIFGIARVFAFASCRVSFSVSRSAPCPSGCCTR